MSNGAAATARRRQQQQEAQEELQRRLQEKFSKHVRDFPINLEFPAKVSSSSSTTASDDKPIRTDTDLIQHRLLEAGVFGTGGSNDRQTVTEVTEAASNFISIMNRSGCYNSVQVKVCGGSSSAEEEEDEGKESLNIVLNEKKWYRLYIGGGLKHEGGLEALETESSSFPKVQFETSGSLLNLTGRLDTTSLQYAVDQTSSTTLSFSHERPLYTVLVENGPLQELLLTSRNNNGSQASIAFRAVLDTLDHEGTRSYKEYQRLLSLRIANTSNVSMPESVEGGYSGLNWSLNFRDLIPRRHASLPYAMDASPEIVSQSGPSLKHSLSYEYRTNGRDCDDRFNPTVGVDVHGKVEVAGPPGDVGFVRMQGGASWNVVPLPPDGTWALHGSIQAGILRSLAFGGLCGPASISDRFFVGGPMQLRGFVPAGIGPRAKTGGASCPGGDSLGGDLFYTATLAASLPFPAIAFLRDNGVRCFGFANVGTVSGLDGVPLTSILQSTRASVGGGVSLATSFGRLEATYATPLRYSPRDARKSVQIGLGFSFG